jgi:two-component system chemotaxis sensor kinase CheA
MQPLDKLFGRYPRLIRDLATKTGKQIQLVIEGGDTEVDKSVIEELGDPLVHLIRNSADHGLEGPEERTKAGKSALGTITLRASHEGSHVRVLVMDDGRGLARERIAKKAIERGLTTQEQVSAMSDREVFNFIFEAGFSTAEKVSDLSGRGVGMDVVRTNIQKLKGSIELSSQAGNGTTVAITIPLTVAILQAMMVGVGPEIYAVPLTSILEIVRPQADQVSSIGGHQVMRLRDSVLPLVSAADLFEQPTDRRSEQPFAVVIQSGQKQVGLMVSRLIGQQEVVIKPLDEGERTTRAVSGATVRDDGGVSLIVDVEQLVRMAQGGQGR